MSTANEPTPIRISIEELRFFAYLVRELMQRAEAADASWFRLTLDKHCPAIAAALYARFTGPWSTITFCRTVCSTPFLRDDDVMAALPEPEPHQPETESEHASHD